MKETPASTVQPEAPVAAAAPKTKQPAPVVSAAGDQEIPVSGVRKAIAANMLRSKHEIPHAWTMVEVDVTNLVSYRDALKTEFKQKEGFNLTYFAFFVKAVAQALKEFPQMNSMWAGDRIVQKKILMYLLLLQQTMLYLCPLLNKPMKRQSKALRVKLQSLRKKFVRVH